MRGSFLRRRHDLSADARNPGQPMPARVKIRNTRSWLSQVRLRHHERHTVRRRLKIAPQEQTERRAFRGLTQRIRGQIEVTDPRRREHRPAAVAVSESPDAGPALQRAHRAGEDSAHAAKPARPGVIVFGDRERLPPCRARCRKGRRCNRGPAELCRGNSLARPLCSQPGFRFP